MKQKAIKASNSESNSSNQVQKQRKERRTVSWSQEEDDILREQIRAHGTENWAIIASKFKDKTTRQCRRRWFTYLNSDFKKGGWSAEEDMLLCEAQKVYGNRWTEIAKMVAGRTDNAVKNRFATLCKKRAKLETSTEENNTKSYINLNNKRVLSHNGFDADESSKRDVPMKRIRLPLSIGAENIHSCEANLPTQPPVEALSDGSANNEARRSFLEKDGPKVVSLMQQVELLSSLAIKVNTVKTDENIENVWMDREDYLKGNKESEPDMNESSPTGCEFSTGSTLPSDALGDKPEEYEADIGLSQQETGRKLQLDQLDHSNGLADVYGIGYNANRNEVENNIASEPKADEGDINDCCYTEFSSPLHVTPLFRALAAAIPSPQFSESEKRFLMKTLGMESCSPSPIANTCYPLTCKRSLLHCL